LQDLASVLKRELRNTLINNLKMQIDEERLENWKSKFLLYLAELKKWNKAYNLTSIEDEREIIVKHFLDSLLYLWFVPDKPLSLADVGSGGGFPGIPISIIRNDLKISLIEPSWKKCAFLKNIKRKLNLNHIEVFQTKVEDIENTYDIIVSRALWKIEDLIKNTSHILRDDGFFIISKSIKFKEELSQLPKDYKIEIKEFDLSLNRISFPEAKRFIIKIVKCAF